MVGHSVNRNLTAKSLDVIQFGGTVSDTFTVTVKAAPVVASAISNVSGLTVGDTQNVSLSGVFSNADGYVHTVTADTSDFEVVDAIEFHGTLTVILVADGSSTITVTAEDADGNSVSNTFDLTVVGPPLPVAFLWDTPEWSGGGMCAHEYKVSLPGGRTKGGRLIGGTVLRRPGEYQAGGEASVSVKEVYELPHGSNEEQRGGDADLHRQGVNVHGNTEPKYAGVRLRLDARTLVALHLVRKSEGSL
jgi:hypothetical protein